MRAAYLALHFVYCNTKLSTMSVVVTSGRPSHICRRLATAADLEALLPGGGAGQAAAGDIQHI